MTTFEITIITLLGLIAFALIFRDFVIGKALDQIIHNQDAMQQDIRRIERFLNKPNLMKGGQDDNNY